MAVIEFEERASSSATLTFFEVDDRRLASPLALGAGDVPQPPELAQTDAELVAKMLSATRPVNRDRFVD